MKIWIEEGQMASDIFPVVDQGKHCFIVIMENEEGQMASDIFPVVDQGKHCVIVIKENEEGRYCN